MGTRATLGFRKTTKSANLLSKFALGVSFCPQVPKLQGGCSAGGDFWRPAPFTQTEFAASILRQLGDYLVPPA